jgi:hypothetical protein
MRELDSRSRSSSGCRGFGLGSVLDRLFRCLCLLLIGPKMRRRRKRKTKMRSRLVTRRNIRLKMLRSRFVKLIK